MSVSELSQTMQINEIRQKSVLFLHQQAGTFFSDGKFDDAIKACDQLLKIQPDYAPGCKLLGDAYQGKGQLNEAKQWYTQALQLQPDWAEVHANVGSLHAKAKQWQQAMACYQKAITLKPDFAGAYRNLGKVWTQLNQPQEATKCLYQAYVLEPQKATAEEHLNLGNTLLEQGQVSQAETCYRHAIEQNPNLAAAYQSLADVLKQQDKMEEATACYRKAIELKAPSAAPTLLPQETLAGAMQMAADVPATLPMETLAAAVSQQVAPTNGSAPVVNDPNDPATYLRQAQGYCALKRWDQVIAACQKALRLQPQFGEAYKVQGNALQMLGEMEAAVRAYTKALEVQPQYPEVYANLGSLYAQQERLEKALSYYQQAINQKPDFAGAYRNLAKIFNQLGKPEQASAALEKAYSLEPDKATPEEHLNLGNTRLGQGKFDEALKCYQRALQLNPKLGIAYYKMGQIHSQKRQWNEALTCYQKAVELEPKSSDSYYQIGEILEKQGRGEEALIAYQKAIEVGGGHTLSFHRIGDILNQQWRLEEAIAFYRQAISRNPKLAESYLGLGQALAKQQQWPEALNALKQGLSLNGKADAETYKFLGDALLNTGDAEQGIQAYQKAVELKPDWGEIYQKLGNLWKEKEQFEPAISAFRRAIEINPDVSWSHNSLADIFSKQENWQEAVICYRRAIELHPDFSWSHNSLGEALQKLERWEEAVIPYQRAIALNPEFAWSYYNLGEVCSHLKKWDEAVQAYRGAIQLQPDLTDIEAKLGNALHQRAKLDLEEALGYYRQAIQHNPDNVSTYHKALDIKPDDGELYVLLANTYSRQNNLVQAIVFYQIALELDPGNTEAAQQLDAVLEKKNRIDKSSEFIPGVSEAKKFSDQPEVYQQWLKENTPTPEDLVQMGKSVKKFRYKPRISLMLSLKTPSELHLKSAIQSVLDQVYPDWELCIIGDQSTDAKIKSYLESSPHQDQRIKVISCVEAGQICANLNTALEQATGEFIALFNSEDLLAPEALFEIVTLLNQHPEADLIYSDEDRLNSEDQLVQGFFKPDWCPDSFLSRMYTGNLGIYRRSLVQQIGGFRVGYEASYDYDFVLRFTEKTHAIFHVPKVLYHSRKGLAFANGNPVLIPQEAEQTTKQVILEALQRRGEPGSVEAVSHYSGVFRVRYTLSDYKLVSIIIPTRNLGAILNRCLHSIFEKTTYPNYEVIVIDNGSDQPETLNVLKTWKQKEPHRFQSYRLDIPFNFSKLNNDAVTQAKGDYLLFLNNDTEVITPDWIEAMVEQVQRPSIGAVGALLLYPDNTIQHAGVIMGLRSVADHGHRFFAADDPGYFGQILSINNYSSITAACLMCRREVFEMVGGFYEELAVAFNDVDFCLELGRRGYRHVYLPHVRLYHHESKSRGYEDTAEKQRRFMNELTTMRQRWASIIDADPCYNPNLNREQDDYSLRISADLQILSVERCDENANLFWNLAIDAPAPGLLRHTNTVRFSGWIIGHQKPIMAVRLMASYGRMVKLIPSLLPRPDVAKEFPDKAEAKSCGFWAEIEIMEILEEQELILEAVFEDGTSQPVWKISMQKVK